MVKIILAIILVLFGIMIIIRHNKVAKVLEDFYKKYPFIRYASDKQFKMRPIFIISVGVTIIFIGIIAFVDIVNYL
ncbi:MAG: hypothetical protein ABII88_07625 [Candidatus Omnitrophota bacterium]